MLVSHRVPQSVEHRNVVRGRIRLRDDRKVRPKDDFYARKTRKAVDRPCNNQPVSTVQGRNGFAPIPSLVQSYFVLILCNSLYIPSRRRHKTVVGCDPNPETDVLG